MKIFKIALVSDDLNSYTGSQFDANFLLDLKRIIRDPNDFDKPYEVTFTFRSISALSSNSTLSMTNLYAISFDFGRGSSTYQYQPNKTYNGILNLENDFTSYTSTVCPIFFNTKESDNGPMYIDNIRELNNVRLNVITTNNNATFNESNNATINSYTRYICMLTFKQL